MEVAAQIAVNLPHNHLSPHTAIHLIRTHHPLDTMTVYTQAAPQAQVVGIVKAYPKDLQRQELHIGKGLRITYMSHMALTHLQRIAIAHPMMEKQPGLQTVAWTKRKFLATQTLLTSNV